MSAPHALSRRRTVLGLTALFGGFAATAGVAIGAAAGVGAVWHATNPPGAAPAAAAGGGSTAAVQLVVKNVSTPDGPEPAFVGPGGVGKPVLFQVHKGTATTVTIVNRSDQPHTFTSAALGVDVVIPAGPSTTHFTVDAKSTGQADWTCNVPCGAWVMSHDGYMMGDVEVVA